MPWNPNLLVLYSTKKEAGQATMRHTQGTGLFIQFPGFLVTHLQTIFLQSLW